ncbi:TolC family protein [Geofilum rhodophaeum]|uniref:TolC family protein n=1 Tax=Geofilum rhodophaeum TaxID=1965019 RepID=UPI001F0A6BB3|nr:TolC family protein [Geofilum rhodophaeum]
MRFRQTGRREMAVMVLALFLVVNAGRATGQEPVNQSADSLELTLDKALELALSDNPTIVIANKEVERVDYARKEAWSSLFPAISAEGSYTRNMKLPVLFLPEGVFGPGSGGAMEMGYKNSFQGSVTAGMPLFSMSLLQNIKLSEHDMKAALESARASRINMEAEVRRAYFSFLLARDTYEVMAQSVENAEVNLESVRQFYGQGLVAEYDVIRSEVQVRNLKPGLVQAENGVRMSEMMVRVLLGLGQEIPIKVSEALFDFEGVGLSETAGFGDGMLEQNTQLTQLDLQLEKMRTQFKLVRSQRYPTLSAFMSYQAVAQANDFKFGDYQWANPLAAGLQLSFPIFQGFSIRNQEKQVAVGREQLQLQRDYTVRNLVLQLNNANTNMLKALEQIESNREGVRLAERGFRIAQTRYKAGAGTLLELNDAEMALTQAKLNLSQAMFDYLSAETEYRQVLGREE